VYLTDRSGVDGEEPVLMSKQNVGMAWVGRAALGVGLLCGFAGALSGCSSDASTSVTTVGDDYYFNGMVYDGATGARLTAYGVTLQYFNRTYTGKVDAAGRYFLGPLRPNNDYTIGIQSDGYRSFLSHNALRPVPKPGEGESLFYDAYLFPTALAAPDAKFSVALEGSTDLPSGSIRLRPTSGSILDSDPSEQPAGVGNQVWGNDEDLQFGSVDVPFSKGQVTVPGDQLVYGVSYAVTVYGVSGYEVLTAAYQSGLDSGTVPLVLGKQQETALSLVSRSDNQDPDPSGAFVMVFNKPVEIYPPGTEAAAGLAIDDALSISPIDGDADGDLNTLNAVSASRGVTVTATGTQVKIVWDKTTALTHQDPTDPVTAVTYGALDMVNVRPVGGNVASVTPLAALLAQSSVTIHLAP
jgi:hypothetical protein